MMRTLIVSLLLAGGIAALPTSRVLLSRQSHQGRR